MSRDDSSSDGRDLDPIGTILGDNAGVHIPRTDADNESGAADEPPIDFGSFVVSLGASVMVNLGQAKDPQTGQSHYDLEAAAQTIEILEMLKHKTKGNLDPEEEKLLESLLHDTRAAYDEATDESS